MIKILQEAESDIDDIDVLLDLTFGSGRNALSSYRYREGVSSILELCYVLRDEFGVLVGVIRFWPVLIGFQRLPGLLLGPLAIHPTRQGEGLGEALMFTGLMEANRTGWSRVLLIGDESYYSKFGFSKNIANKIYLNDSVSSERLLGNELTAGSMASVKGPLFNFFD